MLYRVKTSRAHPTRGLRLIRKTCFKATCPRVQLLLLTDHFQFSFVVFRINMKLFAFLLLCSLTIALVMAFPGNSIADADLSAWTRKARHLADKPLRTEPEVALDTVLVKHTPLHPDDVIDLSRRGYGADFKPKYAVFL